MIRAPMRTPFSCPLHEGLAVRATTGTDSPDFAVALTAGTGRGGDFSVYLSTTEARAMAAALIAAADHHDAETAAAVRTNSEPALPCVPRGDGNA